MWGGTPDRNMVSNMKNAPVTWDIQKKLNIKWVATVGSQAYGNPVVAGGMVFIGTNNEGMRDPKQPGDRGVLMAFRESDGEFLWQHTSEKLPAGRVNDWPYQGVASSPLVEGDRLYYVSNRAKLTCIDIKGFTQRERRSRQRREVHRPERRRHHLGIRHDGGGRIAPSQSGEFVSGVLRRSDLREHVERAGREPREYPVAPRSRRSSPSTRRPASLSGKTTRLERRSSMASGPRPRLARSATRCK